MAAWKNRRNAKATAEAVAQSKTTETEPETKI